MESNLDGLCTCVEFAINDQSHVDWLKTLSHTTPVPLITTVCLKLAERWGVLCLGLMSPISVLTLLIMIYLYQCIEHSCVFYITCVMKATVYSTYTRKIYHMGRGFVTLCNRWASPLEFKPSSWFHQTWLILII